MRPVVTSTCIAAALGVAACTLVTSLDGLAGGPGPGDASSESRLDGGVGGGDGAPNGDGDGAADGATFSCVGKDAQLCTTFDDNPLTFDWTDRVVKPASGTARLDDAASRSPPFSFFAQVAAVPTDTDIELGRELAPAKPTTSFDVAFDVRIDQIGDGTWSLSSVQFGNIKLSAERYDLDFEIAVTGTDVRAAILETFPMGTTRNRVRAPLLRYPIEGRWTHVEEHVSFVTNTYDVALDGQSVLVGKKLAPVPPNPDAAFRLGIYAEGLTPAVAVHYDNVVVAVH